MSVKHFSVIISMLGLGCIFSLPSETLRLFVETKLLLPGRSWPGSEIIFMSPHHICQNVELLSKGENKQFLPTSSFILSPHLPWVAWPDFNVLFEINNYIGTQSYSTGPAKLNSNNLHQLFVIDLKVEGGHHSHHRPNIDLLAGIVNPDRTQLLIGLKY